MNISDYPNLCESLGKAGTDKIRFHSLFKGPTSARERLIENPHREYLQWHDLATESAIDDILSGLANLGTSTEKPVSAKRLLVILQSTNRISSGLIEIALDVDQRQARRYMAACKLATFHITKHRNSKHEQGQ